MTLKQMMAAGCIAALGTAAMADGHGGKVKVGMITTLSGGGAGLGIDVRDGFMLAAKGNEALELVIEDDQRKPDIALRRPLRASFTYRPMRGPQHWRGVDATRTILTSAGRTTRFLKPLVRI